jgi:hypothetical protein
MLIVDLSNDVRYVIHIRKGKVVTAPILLSFISVSLALPCRLKFLKFANLARLSIQHTPLTHSFPSIKKAPAAETTNALYLIKVRLFLHPCR